MKDLLLFPCNGNAKEALAVVNAINAHRKTWNVIGFIDDNTAIHGNCFGGFEIVGGRSLLGKYKKCQLLALPGRPENFLKRDSIISSLDAPKTRFATLVHPQAQLSADTRLGYNTLVMAGVTTTYQVRIGNHCVILPNSVLSHDVTIGNYTLVGSNVSVSGGVHIGPRCYIGSGAKLIQEIEIKTGTLVGLGSVVLKNTAPYSVVAGNPARLLRRNIP